MPTVVYVDHSGGRRAIDVPEGENVMHGALYNGVEGIVGECGGALACATCHCYIDAAWVEKVGEPTSQVERDMLESAAAEVRPNSRLGCQIIVSGDLDGLIVHTPETQY
jgi:2Fe-2S ferredoxin